MYETVHAWLEIRHYITGNVGPEYPQHEEFSKLFNKTLNYVTSKDESERSKK